MVTERNSWVSWVSMRQMLALDEKLCFGCDHVDCKCPEEIEAEEKRVYTTCQYCGGQGFVFADGSHGSTAYGDCASCQIIPDLYGGPTTIILVGKAKLEVQHGS